MLNAMVRNLGISISRPLGTAPSAAAAVMWLFLGLGLTALGGCQSETRVVHDAWGSLRELEDQNPPANPTRLEANPQAARGGWAVLLQTFEGSARLRQAEQLVARLRKESLPQEIWVEDVKRTARVYLGRFTDPGDPYAVLSLEQARAITLDDLRPFAGAALAPIGDQVAAASNPYDLKQFPGLFSLQIGFYDGAFGSNFRQAAEQAVKTLRADGVEAYFYHGPNVSMITVGLFTEDDTTAVATPGPEGRMIYHTQYSQRVKDVQKQFPYNLGNGVTVVEKNAQGQRLGEQPSFLVRVF
jgi:hypothetical protein